MLDSWQRNGCVYVPERLPFEVVNHLRSQLHTSLLSQGLDTLNEDSFPKGERSRRVFEVAPVGVGSETWDSLIRFPPLVSALDSLLGLGSWEIFLNESSESTRHWYAPCTAPEDFCEERERRQGETSSPCATLRVCPFLPFSTWKRGLEKESSGDSAASQWTPISRRRHIGSGWHLDVGPGVSSSAHRSIPPHQDAHAAGAVLLIALNNLQTGHGGTAFIPGSHLWVQKAMCDREASGSPRYTHEELNVWVASSMRSATESGRVLLPSCQCGGLSSSHTKSPCNFAQLVQNSLSASISGWSPFCGSHKSQVLIQQMVCEEGSILLMHPLLVHSGSLNLGPRVRLLINGMVRLKKGVQTL